MELSLTPGQEYAFKHLRKGTFRAILVGRVPAREGDEQDDCYLAVKICTAPGSGQEWMAHTEDAPWTEVQLRPSLIHKVTLLTDGPMTPRSLKAQQAAAEPPEPEPGGLARIGQKLKNLLTGGK